MKGTRKTSRAEPRADEPSFEQAIERLEKIVADMEAAELPLDEVLSQYDEGTRLVRFCGQKLEEAEKKIELRTKKADGAVELKPFAANKAAAEANEADQEGRLL